MKTIDVDPAARTVRVGGGVLSAEFDATRRCTASPPPGHGVEHRHAGLTLGGGLGWLMGKHGLTVDNLLAADVVTADGRPRGPMLSASCRTVFIPTRSANSWS
jgi:FAD/FMN-containing dehydrogenase